MGTQVKDRKIILGVTGGIAAYKACILCRLLVKNGAQVFVVMTPAAAKLVGKETFEALSGHPVSIEIFDRTEDISHIALATNADMVIAHLKSEFHYLLHPCEHSVIAAFDYSCSPGHPAILFIISFKFLIN